MTTRKNPAVNKLSLSLLLLGMLFAVTANASDIYDKCRSLSRPEDFEAYAKSVSSNWSEIAEEYRWRVWVDSPAEYQRFVNPPAQEAAGAELVHPTEVYKNGLEQFRAFKEANERLNQIPKGQFKPTLELMSEIHQIAMKDAYSFRQKVVATLGGGFLNIAGPGKIKRLVNFSTSHLSKAPLSDAEVAALRSEGRIQFLSLVRNGPDRNYGILIYPKNPQAELSALIDWYEANQKVLSTIQLAAEFQRRFTQIHAFDQGNGRVARLFMDRILAEGDLPPALLRNHDLDIYMTAPEWAQEVAAGVAQYESIARNALRDSKKKKTSNGAPFVGDYEHGTWILPKSQIGPKMNSELFPGQGKAKITAEDGNEYLLFRDGFFYSGTGIPYVYREGSLYPITDQNYLLYGLGGAMDETKPAIKGTYRRTLSPQMEEVYRGNLEALDRISAGTLDPRTISVQPYATIAEANKKGTLQFQPWEKQWLKGAIEIRETSPAAILASSRGNFTEFEKAFNNGENVRISSILAQYQAVDLNYAQLEFHFRKVDKDPDLVATIQASRKKLWEAIRHYVTRFEGEATKYIETALPEVTDAAERTAIFKQVPQFKLFYEYLPYTRAGYSTWEEATRQVPWDEVFLLRNDFKAIRWAGFIAEGQIAQILKSVPGAEKFRDYVRARLAALPTPAEIRDANEKAKELGTESALDATTVKHAKLFKAIEQKIFLSPFTSRGADQQFQREYVDLLLHAVDQGNKSGVSFTTRSDQMVQNDGNLTFQGVTGAKYQTYIVRLPVDRSVNNYASGWYRQYEVVVKGYSNPTRTVKILQPADYVPQADPEKLKKIEPFITDKQLIRIE